jgi:hypothetical protein
MRFSEIRNLSEETLGTTIANTIPTLADRLKNILSGPASGQGAKFSDPAPKGSTKVNPADVDHYLSSKGLDKNHRVGILANIDRESGFDSGIYGDNGTSGGLFQHHNERFAAMRQAVGTNWQTNWRGQIDFALREPEGQQYLAIRFRNPKQAIAWFTINFERPANQSREVAIRTSYLKKFNAMTAVA